MKLDEYSNEDSTGQPIELRLEETFLRSKTHQHTKMTTEEAIKLIDVNNLLKRRHNVSYETSDKEHDLNNFTTALVASLSCADKLDSIPKPSSEFFNFRTTGSLTTTELLLSKEIGQLGDSGFNATFRTVFLTENDETTFENNLKSKSLNVLIKNARTKISQLPAEIHIQNSYLREYLYSDPWLTKREKWGSRDTLSSPVSVDTAPS